MPLTVTGNYPLILPVTGIDPLILPANGMDLRISGYIRHICFVIYWSRILHNFRMRGLQILHYFFRGHKLNIPAPTSMCY